MKKNEERELKAGKLILFVGIEGNPLIARITAVRKKQGWSLIDWEGDGGITGRIPSTGITIVSKEEIEVLAQQARDLSRKQEKE